MPEIRNLNSINNLQSLTQNQVTEPEMPRVQQTNVGVDGVEIPVGRPDESAQPTGTRQKTEQLMPDVVIGRESSQLVAAEQIRTTGYVSATDKLLGLDLQPTMLGVLAAPPGNVESLRLLTPTMRRKIMRNLLDKQRERMRRLAYSLRRKHEEQNDDDDSSERRRDESFASMLAEDYMLSPEQLKKATDELGKMAKMLDVLDEMLIMQDYTISQMGTFAQG